MDFKEFRDRFALFIEDWQNKRASIPLAAATDASSVAKNRVIQKGISSVGSVFGNYAESTKKRKKKKGRTNAPFPKINFSDTNTMWRTSLPKVAKVTANEVVITIEPTDTERAKIMGIHNKRFKDKGKLLALNKQEIENVQNDYKDELVDTFKKYFP